MFIVRYKFYFRADNSYMRAMLIIQIMAFSLSQNDLDFRPDAVAYFDFNRFVIGIHDF